MGVHWLHLLVAYKHVTLRLPTSLPLPFLALTLIPPPPRAFPLEPTATSNMPRYVVNVVADGRTTSLLIVLPPSALTLSLVEKIKARLPSLNFPADSELTLRLDAPDGPILDVEDLLSEALPDATKEQLFAVINLAETPSASASTAVSIAIAACLCRTNESSRFRQAQSRVNGQLNRESNCASVL